MIFYRLMDLTYGANPKLIDFDTYEEAKEYAKQNLNAYAIKEIEYEGG